MLSSLRSSLSVTSEPSHPGLTQYLRHEGQQHLLRLERCRPARDHVLHSTEHASCLHVGIGVELDHKGPMHRQRCGIPPVLTHHPFLAGSMAACVIRCTWFRLGGGAAPPRLTCNKPTVWMGGKSSERSGQVLGQVFPFANG